MREEMKNTCKETGEVGKDQRCKKGLSKPNSAAQSLRGSVVGYLFT